MKKIYTFVVASTLSVALFAAEEEVLSLSLYDLTKEKLNTTHVDNQKNSITIKTFDSYNGGSANILYPSTSINPLECVGGNASGSSFGYARLEGDGLYSEDKSPTILITLSGDDNITEIEILGYGSPLGDSSLPSTIALGFSKDGITYTKGAGFNPFIKLHQSTCPTATNTKKKVLEGTKYIKLLHTGDYLNWSGLNMQSKPHIHAIRFYAKGSLTNIDTNTQNTSDIKVYERNLQLSKSADVVIYDITGKAVAQFSDIEDAYLDFLNSGVYIICATTRDGVSVNKKVVIK